ncbi:spermatogenesis-associated protein 20 isoform X2 [Lingula anatina]|uniref:Spermatogenesis-associated protein 20 isoform X2 n=1 Tax=Lingula anatina TaxID=7574 RepID=A0A1S3K4Y8_LINAN|nr:spermatogenesis-associated protein 20 isoform X2 [Lingula anatina]|eukprot:XP_013417572.1 spermatogenesis-associated protein 20 isoform X2 [Lingula anatina]
MYSCRTAIRIWSVGRLCTYPRRKYSPHLSRGLHPHLIMATAFASTSSDSQRKQNRLALEKSPYLLQHASNPVDWFPWGEEAFKKAREENKMIFLSVGYSTCHWCHVMERESFENEEIGKIMSDNFVCVKVDREERPDVDKMYMTFIQATSGSGGWPMSVWLTPDLKPIVGGTYFPPDDRYYGRPGFKTILNNLSEQWQMNRDKIMRQGTQIVDAVMQMTQLETPQEDQVRLDSDQCMDTCLQMLCRTYDFTMGGFGKGPKFPQPVNFNFLFRVVASKSPSAEAESAQKMALHTLRMMAKGGIHDHVAQGFHRYSTDINWHVPHFEKMLYDQGQLAHSYLDAYQLSKEEIFADIARDILQYVERDLSDPSGGFYSAEDADSYPNHGDVEKKEGAFCVWTDEEIRQLLGDSVEGQEDVTMADVFCKHFDVKPGGNVDPYKDPHDELKKQNVLIVTGSLEETAQQFNLDLATTTAILEKCKQVLFEVRKKRPKPHLDNKMLTAWNGLMISGFARAGQVLGESKYTDRAIKAASFLKTHMYNAETGMLHRTSYCGEADKVEQSPTPINGFSDDYAFLIRGLLDLYEACYDDQWLSWADQLQDKQDQLFWDLDKGGYFTSGAEDKNILVRIKEVPVVAAASLNFSLGQVLWQSCEYRRAFLRHCPCLLTDYQNI